MLFTFEIYIAPASQRLLVVNLPDKNPCLLKAFPFTIPMLGLSMLNTTEIVNVHNPEISL